MSSPIQLPSLPIIPVLPQIVSATTAGSSALLIAPPGTGKTTVAPLAMAGIAPEHDKQRRVLVVEPRRLAARAAAFRMAQLLGEEVGHRVGYRIRGETRSSPHTLVEVVTGGILLSRLLGDSELSDVDVVMLDECHERHVDTDLALGFLLETREVLRPDLAIVAASATANTEIWQQRMPDASVIDCPGQSYPVQMRWEPVRGRTSPPVGLWVDRRLLTHVASLVRRALETDEGDVLCFLPGAAEIRQVEQLLTDIDAEVVTLHGSSSPTQQAAALRSGQRRVVLSTDIAESSLTVPGVRIVVDAGLARKPVMDHARGLPGLNTVIASRAAAAQRAGRAGRTAPGVVWRAWSEVEHERRPRQPPADIATSELSAPVLQAACWGTPLTELELPEQPPSGGLRAAHRLLRELGALEETGAVTELGRSMERLGVHPRLARALLVGAPIVGSAAACEVVAVVSEERSHRDDDLVRVWRRLRQSGDKWWKREVARLHRLVPPHDSPVSDDIAAATIVGLAFPDRVACRRGGQWLTVSGSGMEVESESSLRGSEWLAIASASRAPGRAQSRIRLAVAMSEEVARELVPVRWESVVRWDRSSSDVEARHIERAGEIELSSRPWPDASPAAIQDAIAEGFRVEGLSLLTWTDAALRLRDRLAFCRQTVGAPWPEVNDESLLAEMTWLEPELSRSRRRRDLEKITVESALRTLIPWSEHLDDVAPENIDVASGRSVRVDYSGEVPVVAVKLQEMFGWQDSPLIAGVPVSLHLLSPGKTTLAVTNDLRSFWAGPYSQVRSEMRGRYPKHPWPQDPLAAEPTRLTNRQMRSR